MKIYTIILNYNNYQKTKKCLEHLLNSTIRTKIIFIDNNSSDDSSLKIKEEFGNKDIDFIFNKENLGYPGGVNIGINKAIKGNADYVFLLNNDAYVLPDTIEKLLFHLEKNEKALIAGPTIFYYHKKNIVWQAGGYFNWLKIGPSVMFKNKRINLDKLSKKIFKVDFLSACVWLVKAKAFKDLGLFYEKFFLYYDDFDFCYRVRKAGYEILYIPYAVAYHDLGDITKTRTSNIALYNLARSYFIFIRKNFNLLVLIYGMAIFFFFYTPFRIYQILKGKQNIKNILYWFKGFSDGLTTSL